MDGKNKVDSEQIMNFLKTPRGKAVLFFGIYLIFFLILGVAAHANGQGDVIGSTDLKLDSPSYNISSIQKGNFEFSYQYNIDGVVTTYSGTKNDNKSLFSDGVTQYFQNDDLYMRNQDGVWVKCDNPYPLSALVEYSTITKILNQATYVSKTELATGEKTLSYQVTSTTLVKILEGLDVDLDDPVNTIELTLNKGGEVVGISYDVSSYAKYKGLAVNQYQITLTYSNFGKIEEIENPV